jgi:chaperonin GroES
MEIDISQFSEVINIVPHLTGDAAKDELRKMGDTVCTEYEYDLISRKDWEENVGVALKLFSSFLSPKTDPWPDCSNVCLPLLAIACLQFQARAYDALIPPKGVVNCMAAGDAEIIKKSERVQKYMNYQLLHKMEGFEEGMDKTLMQLPIVGSVFRKTYFDPEEKVVRSDYISAQDLVLSYYTKTTIEKCPRKTHILYLTPNEVNKRVDQGIFDESAWNLGPGSLSLSKRGEIRESADQASGIKPPWDWRENPRIFLEQHRGWDLNGDGIDEPFVITVDYETRKVVRMTDRRFTDFLGRPMVLEYFTHYPFIPNPEGFYGLGFGILLSRLNNAANTIVNEVIDAGALANLQGGFISKRSGIKRGSLQFKMGEFKEIDTYVDDIQKALFTFDFPGPNQTLYAVLGLLFEYSKLVSSVSETMTGQLPASDTPATTVMALIEEGRKVFSTIHKRIHRSFKKELQKIFRLNSIYLDEKEYFLVLGEGGKPTNEIETVGKRDFISSINVIPVSDPNITSRAEKVLKAQQVYQTTLSNPLTAQNPTVIYEATKRYYEALEIPNIPAILPPIQPPQDLSPQEENSGFLSEKAAQALPNQDHLAHIAEHDSFRDGVFGGELTAIGKRMLENHRREHVSFVYLASTQQQAAGARTIEAMRRAEGL